MMSEESRNAGTALRDSEITEQLLQLQFACIAKDRAFSNRCTRKHLNLL